MTAGRPARRRFSQTIHSCIVLTCSDARTGFENVDEQDHPVPIPERRRHIE